MTLTRGRYSRATFFAFCIKTKMGFPSHGGPFLQPWMCELVECSVNSITIMDQYKIQGMNSIVHFLSNRFKRSVFIDIVTNYYIILSTIMIFSEFLHRTDSLLETINLGKNVCHEVHHVHFMDSLFISIIVVRL
ncbi:hypothetical protein Droror1_Dr00014580 [Drosera rotundifolia]